MENDFKAKVSHVIGNANCVLRNDLANILKYLEENNIDGSLNPKCSNQEIASLQSAVKRCIKVSNSLDEIFEINKDFIWKY